MYKQILHNLKEKAGSLSWPLLIFLLLVLNVKLVIKVAAILLISIINRKQLSAKEFFRQRYLYFYFSLVIIGIIDLILQYKSINTGYLFATALGISFWIMSALIAYHLYLIAQKEDIQKLNNSVSVFFILHITTISINFLRIVLETGSINPYTYTGMNQKYYVSTGDSIVGITFDAPVTTAFICAFGLLYFLYRRKFLLSLACMAALIIMASNFANLLLLGVFVFAFVFNSSKIQKSFIIIYCIMLIIFMAKVSPQNNEHVGRIFYQVIDEPYDLPPVKVIPIDELKRMPDSLLSFEERRKKYAQNYIDSFNTVHRGTDYRPPETILEKAEKAQKEDTIKRKKDSAFYVFHESEGIEEKIDQYRLFIDQMYTTGQQDSLGRLYNWKSPGKLIAAKQLLNYFKNHRPRAILGAGVANFSSRIAFKATLLNIAGRYPEQMKYINSDFLLNHLYLYLYYHSQDQSKHEASNTPDAVYFQLAGEYGIAGLLCLLILYFGFFIRNIRKMSYGLPVLFLLAGAFFAEYWFEQFSVVVVFEVLFFIDMKGRREEQKT